jgi:NADP-dependent alcohol dehydrogenase
VAVWDQQTIGRYPAIDNSDRGNAQATGTESPDMSILERYRVDTEVVLGSGCLAEELARWTGRTRGPGLLVFGRGSSIPPDRQERLICEMGAVDRTVRVVSGVHADMSFERLRHCAAGANVHKARWVAAVGGGAVVDAGKLLALRCRGRAALDEFTSLAALHDAADELKSVPLLAAPTVVGSGAEVSPLSDVLLDSRGVRVPIISSVLYPALAIIDASICSPPRHVQAAAIVDTIAHLLDPWLNSLPGAIVQDETAAGLIRSVIRIARAWDGNALDQQALHRLATISHLAVRPGLARPSAPVSAIHRIEHVMSPRIGCRHGEGLAHLLPAFLRWMERTRRDVLTVVADRFTEMFERVARPSVLVEEWLSSLPLECERPAIGGREAREIANTVVDAFGSDLGQLPGMLSIGRAEVLAVLNEIDARPLRASVRTGYDIAPACNADRVFGGSVAGSPCDVVMTPIRVVLEGLCSSADVPVREGWFPTAIIDGATGRRTLIVSSSPGSTVAEDCLTFLSAATGGIKSLLFIGFAGSLSPAFVTGQSVSPLFVELSPNGGATRRVRTVPFELPSRLPGGDTCVVRSVRCLSAESPDLLELWRWKGVDLVDLETSTVAAWCEERQVPFSAALIVSDQPLDKEPLWRQPALTANSTTARTVQQLVQTVFERVTNPHWEYGQRGQLL